MRVMSLNNQSITAIPGITVGHVTDHENLTGVTVVRFAGPLLGESLLVSFPPLLDMLKFSG